MSAPVHAGLHTPPRDQRQTAPPCAVHAGRYGQQAGGTHPTGMHTCYICFKRKTRIKKLRYKRNFCVKQGLEARVTRISLYLALEKNSTTSFATESLLKDTTPSLIDTQNLIPNNPASKSEFIAKEIWYFPS